MAGAQSPGVVWQFLRTVIGRLGLFFVPVPIGIFGRQLAGKKSPEGHIEFYSHPNFICTMHLIWVGWIVTIGTFYNHVGSQDGRTWPQIPGELLSWPWLFVLIVTLIVMGLEFGRVALGFLIAAILVTGLGLGLLQSMSNIPVFEDIKNTVDRIDVVVEWGVPFVVSFVLGAVYVFMASWRRLNDCWSLKPVGNYLEHENFQEKDRTISKGAKTFVAVFPCLIRRYLYFGFGDIEVRSSTGTTIVDKIEGVLFAKRHADMILSQFATTDVSQAALAEAEEMEEEESADENL